MNIQEISARLAGLAVFRGLLDDPVLADYSALIGALARGAARPPAGSRRRCSPPTPTI